MNVGNTILSIIVSLLVAIFSTMAAQFHKETLVVDAKNFNAPLGVAYFGVLFMLPLYPSYLLYRVIGTGAKASDINQEAVQILMRKEKFHSIPILMLALLISLCLWVNPTYLFGFAIKYISVSVAMSVMSLNAAFVFILSITLLGAKFSWFKALGVVLSVTGVVSLSMDKEFTGNLWGVLIILVATISVTIYNVLIKRVFGEPSLCQVLFFQSLMGLANVVYLTIPVGLLVWTEVEHFVFSKIPWTPLLLYCFSILLYSVTMNFGISLLSPLVISIGVILGVPMNGLCDIVIRGLQASFWFYIGATLITVGFCLTTLPIDNWIQKKEENIDDEVEKASPTL
ncbi:unnamed protein product [Bursaphelenchus okinawaensis]|uniref:EamA domain-containing protein n=1 Tax=Bursaphelenchus okinawaensis TaxID=465554 RepID=A0A811LAF4_9BILA|nr:unnamed protein product [Bursaphelenchus okinawaensis]CAG9122026.1 unnamed protein product [Bursaphelenchus okinawaensis]